jgi:hypothetical protein
MYPLLDPEDYDDEFERDLGASSSFAFGLEQNAPIVLPHFVNPGSFGTISSPSSSFMPPLIQGSSVFDVVSSSPSLLSVTVSLYIDAILCSFNIRY